MACSLDGPIDGAKRFAPVRQHRCGFHPWNWSDWDATPLGAGQLDAQGLRQPSCTSPESRIPIGPVPGVKAPRYEATWAQGMALVYSSDNHHRLSTHKASVPASGFHYGPPCTVVERSIIQAPCECVEARKDPEYPSACLTPQSYTDDESSSHGWFKGLRSISERSICPGSHPRHVTE